MLTENQLNKLDTMNYRVITANNDFYLYNGLSDLRKICKRFNLVPEIVFQTLIKDGYVSGEVNTKNDCLLEIAMI